MYFKTELILVFELLKKVVNKENMFLKQIKKLLNKNV